MKSCRYAVCALLSTLSAPWATAAAPPRTPTAAPDRATVAKALGISPDRIISTATGSLNRDQTMQTVVITYRTIEKGHPLGGEILVLEPWRRRTGSSAAGSSGLRVVWRHRNLNPWKLALADVDGNGRREIAVGVWKKSPKDPVMARRTFFYRWNGRRLLPKWLGSRLSRRFDDFALGDLNGDGWDELVALEIAPRGRRRISVYRWHSFGFSWLGGTDEFVGLNRLETVRGRVVASGRGIRKTVAVAHGRIILIK